MAFRFHLLTIVSSVVLLLGSIAVLVALTTSYWNYYHLQIQVGGGVKSYNEQKGHRGLIYTCYKGYDFLQVGETCFSRYKQYQLANGKQAPPNFAEIVQAHDWEYACLVLLSLSATFGLGALLLAPLCCHHCLCGVIHAVFIYLSAIFAFLGMGVYMVFQLINSMTQNTQWMKFDSFGWSFVVCIFGVIFQFIAAALYTVAACCCHSKDVLPFHNVYSIIPSKEKNSPRIPQDATYI